MQQNRLLKGQKNQNILFWEKEKHTLKTQVIVDKGIKK